MEESIHSDTEPNQYPDENGGTGPDDIRGDVLKFLKENVSALVELFNDIYDTGHIPKDWLFIPIEN